MYKCSKHNRDLYATIVRFKNPDREMAVFRCPVAGCDTMKANKWARKNAKRSLKHDTIANGRT